MEQEWLASSSSPQTESILPRNVEEDSDDERVTTEDTRFGAYIREAVLRYLDEEGSEDGALAVLEEMKKLKRAVEERSILQTAKCSTCRVSVSVVGFRERVNPMLAKDRCIILNTFCTECGNSETMEKVAMISDLDITMLRRFIKRNRHLHQSSLKPPTLLFDQTGGPTKQSGYTIKGEVMLAKDIIIQDLASIIQETQGKQQRVWSTSRAEASANKIWDDVFQQHKRKKGYYQTNLDMAEVSRESSSFFRLMTLLRSDEWRSFAYLD